MSKGSGRRRITPSDGLQYDPNTDMTNIEERGASHHQSGKKELRLGLRTGARPTTQSYYGNSGKRWGGRGRKDDNRNWKSSSKGKQYEKNLEAREAQEHHRPVPDKVAKRSREKSINSDIKHGLPCKAWSFNGRSVSMTKAGPSAEKFLVKHAGPDYKGYAVRAAQPYRFPAYDPSKYVSYRSPSINTEPPLMKMGFAAFEEIVNNIQWSVSYGQ